MPYKDKESQKQYQADWHKRQGIRERRNKKERSITRFLREVKMTCGCIVCGYNEHFAALDFDHRPGETKKFQLAAVSDRSWKQVVEEMMKCDILCANHHRIDTYEKTHGALV